MKPETVPKDKKRFDSPGKGSGWEREVARRLSLWISKGEDANLFERNVGSGGAFTMAARRGGVRGIPGDLMSVHPQSYQFLQKFFVEAKFWRDLNLEAALWKKSGEFYKVIEFNEKQGKDSKRELIIIAKQNHKPPLLFMPYETGIRSFAALSNSQFTYHGLWRNRIFVCLFGEALRVDPDKFLQLACE